jgi:predicted transporter
MEVYEINKIPVATGTVMSVSWPCPDCLLAVVAG